MDWLGDRQGAIEATLARRHLAPASNPSALAYFDLSSSWVEGSKNELAARGYSRDKKRGMAQIEYGLLTDKDGRPVAIEVFSGNTADPSAFISIVETIRTRFGLDRLTMVGDRGMVTSARITALREVGDLGWLTCLRAPQIAALVKDFPHLTERKGGILSRGTGVLSKGGKAVMAELAPRKRKW